jgi:predicted CoA-substrate-specific enzyme activase
MICAGIDAGSRTVKVVLLEAEGLDVLTEGVMDQGVEQDVLAQTLLERLLERQGVPRRDVRRVVATGYGRKLITVADETITEITCQAWGVRHRMPEARTIVDIGGQDSKLLRLSADGTVQDFSMNDRCAAGTGRFLEVVATRLGVKLAALGELAARSRKPAIISSMCVVFAETEIVGLLASGMAPEDIAVGVQTAIATRVAGMAGQNVASPVAFTGGVALVPGMDGALESALGAPVTVVPDPQTTAALGAAILAARRLRA